MLQLLNNEFTECLEGDLKSFLVPQIVFILLKLLPWREYHSSRGDFNKLFLYKLKDACQFAHLQC